MLYFFHQYLGPPLVLISSYQIEDFKQSIDWFTVDQVSMEPTKNLIQLSPLLFLVEIIFFPTKHLIPWFISFSFLNVTHYTNYSPQIVFPLFEKGKRK